MKSEGFVQTDYSSLSLKASAGSQSTRIIFFSSSKVAVRVAGIALDFMWLCRKMSLSSPRCPTLTGVWAVGAGAQAA